MRATLTINLDAIVRNWRALDAMTASGVETAAVVKANAYGLGLGPVATALRSAGVKTFFVALADEGVQLRKIVGPDPQIYVFSGYMQGDADAVENANLLPLLNSIEQATNFFGAHPGQKYGVQIDTGMNRLGMEIEDYSTLPPIKPELIISHLACADEPKHPQNAEQLAVFCAADMSNARSSLAATGGILLGPDYHMNLTRPGIGLYGGLPFDGAEPVVKLALPIIQTRIVKAGESVGYGASWISNRPSHIATVAAGYADGLIRAMGGNATLYADHTPCPIVGRISMDLITVDVTDLETVPDSLDILNSAQTIDVLADAAGTIGYEILTSLGGRFKRRYIGG